MRFEELDPSVLTLMISFNVVSVYCIHRKLREGKDSQIFHPYKAFILINKYGQVELKLRQVHW